MPDITTLPERWTAAWSCNDAKAWVNLFASDANYIDHAFRISRTGHDALYHHFGLWRTSNPDFIMTVNPTTPVWWRDIDNEKGNGKCSFRTVNKGTFKNDLPTKKASGREFEFSGVLDFVIENGLIVQLNEWYTIEFDLSVPVAQYRQ